MAKRLSFRGLLMAGLALFALPLVGCSGAGPQESGFNITWQVPEHAEVKAEGYNSLPSKLPEDTELRFEVNTDSGYGVTSVKSTVDEGRAKKISEKNGFYTIIISGDTVISVEVSKSVGELNVTTQPTKLTYYAGDELDTTGLAIEAVYVDGTREPISLDAEGLSISPKFFEGGETSFKISYLGIEKEVQLASRVEYQVKIDPDGGTIDAAWVSAVEAMNLHNFSKANGVISFTFYKDLEHSITLPTSAEMSKDGCAFLGWTSDEPISNSITESLDLKANWKEELVKITSLHLVKKDTKPYLVLKGQFGTATQVYFYLYEGNADIELKDETITGTTGQSFEFNFDLTKLSDKGDDFAGKWMDIKFVAESGAEKKVMELYTSDNFEMDLGESLSVGGFVYSFQTWGPDGSSLKAIKIVFESAGDLSYAITFDGANVIFSGVCALAGTAGKTMRLSWWIASEEVMGESTIGSDGKFSITAPLSFFDGTAGGEGYCHYTIYETIDGVENIIAGGLNSDLSYLIADNSYSAQQINGNDWKAFSYEVDGKVYYFGSRWTVLMVTLIDKTNIATASLVNVDGVANVKISFPLKAHVAADLDYGFDLQSNGNTGMGGDWSYPYSDTDGDTKLYPYHATVGAEKFEILLPISSIAALADGVTYGFHLWFVNYEGVPANGDIKNVEFDVSATLTVGAHVYQLVSNSNTWSNLSISVAAAA